MRRLPRGEVVPVEHEESEWKELTVFAVVCGVCGIAGFITEHFALLPAPYPIFFYAAALLAGGWDAAKDSWGNPFQYVVPGDNGRPYEVYSLGADGVEGGEEFNADIYQE